MLSDLYWICEPHDEDRAANALLRLVGEKAISEIAEEANKQKLQYRVYQIAEKIGLTELTNAIDSFRPRGRWRPPIKELLKLRKSVLRSVVSHASAEGISCLHIKGFSIEEYYPEGYSRQFVDFDLVVETPEQASILCQILYKLGFSQNVGQPFWFYVPELQQKCLMIELRAPELGISAEVHSGFFPYTITKSLPTAEWIKGSILLNQNTVLSPQYHQRIIIQLAELTTRNQPHVRDLLDWNVLLEAGNHVTMHAVSSLIDYFDLGSQLRKLKQFSIDHSLPLHYHHYSLETKGSIPQEITPSRTLIQARVEQEISKMPTLFKDHLLFWMKEKINVRQKWDHGGLIYLKIADYVSSDSLKLFEIEGVTILQTHFARFIASSSPIFYEDETINDIQRS